MSLPSMRRSDVFNASIRYCIRFELLNRDMNSKLQSGSTLWTWCKRYKDVHLQRSMQHLNPLRAILRNQYVSRLSPLPGLSVSWLQLVFRFGRPLNLLGTFASFAAGFRFLRSAEMELFRWHLNRQRLKHLLRLQGNAFRKVKWCNGASPYVWKVVVMPVLRQSRRPSMEKRTAKEAKYCVPGQRPFLRFIQGAHEASLKIRGIICLP